MRIEREGPPLLADGSLDYTESTYEDSIFKDTGIG